MSSVFVTTFVTADNKGETFIRVNNSITGAIRSAFADVQLSLSEYEEFSDSVEIGVVPPERPCQAFIVRIVDNDTGHEFEAYLINERTLED